MNVDKILECLDGEVGENDKAFLLGVLNLRESFPACEVVPQEGNDLARAVRVAIDWMVDNEAERLQRTGWRNVVESLERYEQNVLKGC